jgi:chemotaxis protein CheZ
MAQPAEMPADLHAAIEGFCEKDPEDLQLVDVLKVTEILACSLRDVFSHEDTPIYSSAIMMASYLRQAQDRLKNIRPTTLRDQHLPSAQEELDAIVAQTEAATTQIMELAEAMLAIEPEAEAYHESINDHIMQIFEACAFQDITGQRAARVSDTLQATSAQIDKVVGVLGASHDETVGPAGISEKDQWREDNLLHGPQNEDDAISQDDVDDVINQDDIDSLFD